MYFLCDGLIMRYSRDDIGAERVATIDIETTHYKPAQGETVSIGVGVHDRGTPADEATYEMIHRNGQSETALMRDAIGTLNEYDADVLVSYKGRGFDLQFLQGRAKLLDESFQSPALDTRETHVDLFADRKTRADQRGDKWPSLEECLGTYYGTKPTTNWGGTPLTNVRFGEELGPAYLLALSDGDNGRVDELTDVIEHYLVTDLEANIAIYYGDIGEEFEPCLINTEETFTA